MDQQMDHRANKSSDCIPSKESTRFADKIIPQILNLYASRATSQDFEIYTPDATFEDPLMCAHGVPQIKSSFYSLSKLIRVIRLLSKLEISQLSLLTVERFLILDLSAVFLIGAAIWAVFSESSIVEHSITENVLSKGKHEILIDTKQHYKFMGSDIEMISLIKLDVEDGKIVRHEDRWNKKPLLNRDTAELPLFGRALETARRASMVTTHGLMQFGKDPTT